MKGKTKTEISLDNFPRYCIFWMEDSYVSVENFQLTSCPINEPENVVTDQIDIPIAMTIFRENLSPR